MEPLAADLPTPGQSVAPGRRPILGVVGLCLGVVGFALAVLTPQIVKVLDPPKPLFKMPEGSAKAWVSDTLAEAGDKFVGKTMDRVRGSVGKTMDRVRGRPAKPPAAPAPAPTPVAPPVPAPPPHPLGWDWYLETAGPAFGLLAALTGLMAWLRREDLRVAGSALGVGVLAVAWVHILTALVIAFVIVLLVKLRS